MVCNWYNYIAKSLASSTGWNNSEVVGAVGNFDYSEYKNKTGFSALPGGFRYYSDGSFMYIGNSTLWWSANDDGNIAFWNRIKEKIDGLIRM